MVDHMPHRVFYSVVHTVVNIVAHNMQPPAHIMSYYVHNRVHNTVKKPCGWWWGANAAASSYYELLCAQKVHNTDTVKNPVRHMVNHVHHPVHNPLLLTSRPVLPPDSGFVPKGMPQGHEKVTEEQVQSMHVPVVGGVAQAASMETEEQDFDEQEEVVDPNLEMFLRQAKREELVKLSSSMNSKLQKFKKGQQNLEFQLQELREGKYRRHVQWMEEKKKLKNEMWRLQLKLNAFTGLNPPSSKSYDSECS